MLYEIWLGEFKIPVLPKEIKAYEENDISNVTIDGLGEISKTTNTKLRTFEISSFFYDPTKPKPSYAVEYTISVSSYEDINAYFHNIQRNNKVVDFKIYNFDIDTKVQINKYEWYTNNGSSDIYYNLSLIEYKEVGAKKVNDIKTKRENEIIPKSGSTTYIVKYGDTLYNIAKAIYGDGNKYMEIATKNNIANPNRIYEGQVLSI